jgi:hypothetical protein
MTAIRKLPIQRETMHSGDDKLIQLTVRDQDAVVIDITGATMSFVLSEDPGDVALFELTVGSGITLIDPTNGRADIRIADTDTAALAGLYYFEVTLTDATALVSTVAYGYINVLRNSN